MVIVQATDIPVPELRPFQHVHVLKPAHVTLYVEHTTTINVVCLLLSCGSYNSNDIKSLRSNITWINMTQQCYETFLFTSYKKVMVSFPSWNHLQDTDIPT